MKPQKRPRSGSWVGCEFRCAVCRCIRGRNYRCGVMALVVVDTSGLQWQFPRDRVVRPKLAVLSCRASSYCCCCRRRLGVAFGIGGLVGVVIIRGLIVVSSGCQSGRRQGRGRARRDCVPCIDSGPWRGDGRRLVPVTTGADRCFGTREVRLGGCGGSRIRRGPARGGAVGVVGRAAVAAVTG